MPLGLSSMWLTLALLMGGCSDGDESTAPEPMPGAPVPVLVASDLGFITDIQGDPDDAGRLFVANRAGEVRIVQDGIVAGTPFLDIRALVRASGEQGLLGLALAPDHATSGRFYVHHSDLSGNTVVARYVTSADPGVADAGSREVVFSTAQPHDNHNGGTITFGPDGHLYLALGDGGGGGDPDDNAQDPSTVLGSILRLDVSGSGLATAPADNPFAGGGGHPLVWSYGLRNPWRISFDRANGDLYIADVGQGEWEEVNVAPAPDRGRGVNWGWNVTEGPDCYSATTCDRTGLTGPAHAYDHDDGCSITGGHVYRGSAVPALAGRFLFADYCSNWIRSITWNGSAATDAREWAGLHPNGQVTTFGQAADGELYMGVSAGRLYRIEELPAP